LPRTRILIVDRDHPELASLREAASVLSRGGLVAFATETVYGLGAAAGKPAAVARIFAAKGRPSFNPLIVHVAGIEQAKACTTAWPETARRLAERFWPGPLTMVLPRSAGIPDLITAGRATVALRAPAPSVARGLIELVGQPLAAPSANRSSRVSPTRAEHVLSDLDGLIDLILDSGPTELGLESTVLDLSRSPARVLRPGPIGTEEIEECLSGLDQVEPPAKGPIPTDVPASPGMLPIHYAPRTPAWRVESVQELGRITRPERSALVTFGTPVPPGLAPPPHHVDLADPTVARRELYSTLHQLDALGLEEILILMPPDRPEWGALRDRLMRATSPVTSR
jgi:L-threonylcarbamoyladenylate synthase